jgi:hypothetical protein
MRLPKAVVLGAISLMLLLTASAQAQFYAPDTEYHDLVQRVFPVEAARVLAWRANQQNNQIAEVSYSVSTSTNGTTTWQLSWLDKDGKPVKTTRVEYPANLLKQGVGFYREVTRQLMESGWEELQSANAAAVVGAYWKGAGTAAVSREESLGRALAMISKASPQADGVWAAQLAGLLSHTTLPSYAGSTSLDDQLAARAAIWLALSERSCRRELSRPWATILFFAGREHVAVETWDKASETNSTDAADESIAAWNLWLHKPKTKDLFLFALNSKNRAIPMAMLATDAGIKGSGKLLAEMVEAWMGSSKALAELHNYGLLFSVGTGVGGGHILNGAWPAYQRRAWVDLLLQNQGLASNGLDTASLSNFQAALTTATNGVQQLLSWKHDTDASLKGFVEVAPLLELGHKEGVGKLAPTAAVTFRDVLNYGWEMTGLQMGARYCFVQHRWGVPEHAKPIFDTVTSHVEGLYPFFRNAKQAEVYNYQECLYRLQRTSGFTGLVGWSPGPYCKDGEVSKTCAEDFMKRCWLRSDLFDWQARGLWDAGRFDLISNLVESFQQEGGAMAATSVLCYLAGVRKDEAGSLPKLAKWKTQLSEQLPQPTLLAIQVYRTEKLVGRPFLERAKELERLYWQNPDSATEDTVFFHYSCAGALDAAKRFYLESRENLNDSVRTSNGLGHYAWLVGYFKGDASLREMAMEDSASSSYQDMILHIWDAAIQDDRVELKKLTEEAIERYEPDASKKSVGRRLKEFLPLLPALSNAADPQHKKAIDFFHGEASWVVLRWLWIEKFKLSKDDAIAFLGGRETDPARHVLVCYFQGDAEGARSGTDALLDREDVRAELRVLARCVSMKMAKGVSEPSVPDLKPVDAVSARAAVLARLADKQR